MSVPENFPTYVCIIFFIFCLQALKVKMRQNMVDEIVEVYADPDGSEAYGSTVATYVDGKVIIGTVQHQLVVCDSKYIA